MSNFQFLRDDWPEFIDDAQALQQSMEEKNIALEQRNREIKQMRLQTRKFADHHDYYEAETRKLLIDLMLRESGWDPAEKNVREYEVTGMPIASAMWIKFVRSVSGLKRERVIQEFEEFLQDNRLSSNQIQFIEQMIEFYTQKGHLEIANLYEPPFDFIDEDGIEGVFDGRGNIIDMLVAKVEQLNDIKTA